MITYEKKPLPLRIIDVYLTHGFLPMAAGKVKTISLL